MKKLFLIFVMAAVSAFGQNIKVASPSTPSQNILSGVTINNSTNLVVPGTFTVSGLSTFNGNFTGIGADYLLNSQTLTGNGSVLTRGLGDARYSPIGGVTTNSNTFADNSTNSFYDLIVRNTFQQTGALASNLFLGPLTVSNTVLSSSTITASKYVATSAIVSSVFGRGLDVTNTTSASVRAFTPASKIELLAGTDASIQVYTNTVVMSRLGVSTANNNPFTGIIAGDTYFRAAGGGRFVYANTNGIGMFYDGITHTFVIGNVVISNNLTVVGSTTSTTNNSTVYQVSGVTGFNGVVTNDIGTVTNIMFYGSGILTNLVRIP